MKDRLLGAVSILCFAALGGAAIGASAPAYDEPVHLASGYAALAEGRLLNAMDHPPLAEAWAALPLLFLAPSILPEHPDWKAGRVYNYADAFLYKNRIPAERLLDAARWWGLATWALLLGVPILLWARDLAGREGLLAAAVLFPLCPPLTSNAALVGTDAAAAAFFFLAFWLLSRERWAGAGAAIGLGMASKFSLLVLPPLAAAMILLDRGLRGRPFPVKGALLAGVAALVCLAGAYHGDLALYARGLTATLTRLGEGRASFLAGRHLDSGHPLFFPAALALKTPLPLLLAAGVGLIRLLRSRDQRLLWLAGPPAAFFLLACSSKTQIGLRHVLPVYPFLVVLAAAGVARFAAPLRLALALVLGLSVARAGAHPLAYFNELAGGPEGGRRWLVDSNLDWGQGLEALGVELRRRGHPPIYLSYFGTADPSYYGIRYAPLACVSNVERREGIVVPGPAERVLLAVSATNLVGNYHGDRTLFAWLESRTPVFSAGGSLLLYDLTEDAEGARALAGLIERSGNPGAARSLLLRYPDAR